MKKAALPALHSRALVFSLHAISFSLGFFLYLLIEKLFKSFSGSPTHWSMGLAAGLAFLFLLHLDKMPLPLWCEALMGGLFITAAELVAGWILNLRHGLAIWNYSDLPLNFHGQICLSFSLLWCVASVGIVFCNRALITILSEIDNKSLPKD